MSKTNVVLCLLLTFGFLAGGSPAQASENGYYTTDVSQIKHRTFYPTVKDGYRDSPGTFGVFMKLDGDNYEPRYFVLRWEVLDSEGENVGEPVDWNGYKFDWDGELDFCGQYYDYCKRWNEEWYGRVATSEIGKSKALPVGEYTVRALSYDYRWGSYSERVALSQKVTIAKGTRTVTRQAYRFGSRARAKKATGSCTVKKKTTFGSHLKLACGKRGNAKATWRVTVPADGRNYRPVWRAHVHKKKHVTLRWVRHGRVVRFTAKVRGHNARVQVREVQVFFDRTLPA